eukprot:TRINITY_DN6591_c0_g1_i2.p1 TRINITY_DN6591_c0_g1~~TRINITY_DN6591_c0_g1_i2.p1  ORF type:complete len:682 (-),score=94.00 TRINITY_DN6591_c0_g1_i2:12-2015(-)
MDFGYVGHSGPPLKFTFQCIDEPNCPNLRGARVLSDFVNDHMDSGKINDIFCSNGRFLVVFDNRQSFVVFDSVPPLRELRVLYSQLDILLKQLKGLASVAKERPVPDVLVERLTSPIVHVQFHQVSPSSLVLCVVQANGKLGTWEWTPSTCRWKQTAQILVTHNTILHAVFAVNTAKAGYSLVWRETNSSNLHVKNISWKLQTAESSVLVASLGTRRELMKVSADTIFFGTDLGIWVSDKPRSVIQFWDFASVSLFSENVFSEGSTEKVSHMVQHPITKEIVVLSDAGRITVCSHTKNRGKLTVSSVATLSDWETKEENPCIGIDIMHCFLVLYYSTVAKVYTLTSGTLIGTADLPFKLRESKQLLRQAMTGDCPIGLWGDSGVFKLQSRKISEIAQYLYQLSYRNAGESAKLCKLWGLDRLYAKFQFLFLSDIITDFVTSEEKPLEKLEEIREACKALAPCLENPSLLLCLLSEIPSLATITIKEVELFLKRLRASCLPEEKEGEVIPANVAANKKEAYQCYTPLNLTMEAMLSTYYKGPKGEDNKAVKKRYNRKEVLSSLSPQQVLALDYKQLQRFISSHPSLLLEKLEEALNISTFLYPQHANNTGAKKIHSSLYHPIEVLENGVDPTTHVQKYVPYFEILVELYYNHKPTQFISFVNLFPSDH